jgi:hypothetical protein
MTAGVGISIQDNEILRAPMDNELAFVLSRILFGNAEDAAGIGFVRAGDVFVPPGTPECFHEQCLEIGMQQVRHFR